MPTREKATGSPREYNRQNAERIKQLVRELGTNVIAHSMGVNPRYVSDVVRKDVYPANIEIATKMGFRIYEVKSSVPHGAPRKRYKRAHVSKNTNPKKIAADLLEVTGDVWVRLEEELEY